VLTDLGFRVERDGRHFVWKLIREDGRVRSATPEERALWDRVVELEAELEQAWLAAVNDDVLEANGA
jgi:hypothetical protein